MTRNMASATLPETKHTPSRWLTKQLFGSDFFVLLREEGVRTHRLDDKGQFSREDAALIARAPGLLAENERLKDALRSLASYVGAGGHNATDVNPEVFEDKIRWGIDHLHDVTVQRCADAVEEQSKNYARASYGDCYRAVLNLKHNGDERERGEEPESDQEARDKVNDWLAANFNCGATEEEVDVLLAALSEQEGK